MAKQQTERLGIAFLMNFFAEHGWLFREQPIHDYGIDAHVEIWNDENYPSGKNISIQVKSGESHFSSHFNKEDKSYFEYSGIEEKHKKYWSEHFLPVIIVLYHPEKKQAYWASPLDKDFVSTGKYSKLVIEKINDFSNPTLCLEKIQSLYDSHLIKILETLLRKNPKFKEKLEYTEINSINKKLNTIGLQTEGTLTSSQKDDKHLSEKNIKLREKLEHAIKSLIDGKTNATNPQVKEIFLSLQEGDSGKLLEIFETQAEHFEKEAKKAAEVQRNIGALAFFSDTEKSRKAYLRATQLDPDNADGFNQLGHILHLTGNLKDAIAAYENVLELGKKNANPKEVAAAYNGLGNIYKYSNNDKAVEFYKKALAIGEDSKIQAVTATACENIAVAYCENGNFDEAIKQYEKALEINKKLGDREGMASNYLNLGTMYYDRERYTNTNSKNFDVAIQYLNDALDISESLKDQEKIAIIYGALGNVHQKFNDFDKAIDYYDKALKINEDLGRKEGIAVQYENLGNLWIIKDLDKAFAYYNDALKINESLEIKSRIALDYANMGLVRKRQNKYAEARQYWQQSIALDSQHTATVQHWLNALPE